VFIGARAGAFQRAERRIVIRGCHVLAEQRRKRVGMAERSRLVAAGASARGDALVHVELAKAIRGRLRLTTVRGRFAVVLTVTPGAAESAAVAAPIRANRRASPSC